MMPTSEASERSFSLARLTITDRRSRLDPNTANETQLKTQLRMDQGI
jgi:hypothetical protein